MKESEHVTPKYGTLALFWSIWAAVIKNKKAQTGDLGAYKQQLLFTGAEAGKARSGLQQIRYLVRTAA